MSTREIASRVLKSRISSNHIERGEGVRIVVTDPDGVDFYSNQRNEASILVSCH
ncbi:MAG: hypothetical protein ACR5KV_07635 [Wolbachia sp.]